MKKLLILIFVLFNTQVDAQNLHWAKATGGINNDYGYSTTTDDQNNVYTSGYFLGIVDFDPGPGVFNLNGPGFNNDFFYKS